MSFTDDGKLVAYNSAVCDALGFTSHELEGVSLDKILPVASRIFYQTHWFPTLRLKGSANEIFVSFLRSNKSELPVLLNSSRHDVNGQMIVECVGIIVTNRVKYEEELLAAKKAYESALSTNSALYEAKESLARHMEQLDRSFSQLDQQHTELKQISKVVTHDLQEPVRKLLYYTDVLNELRKNLSPDVVKKVERLQSVGMQLQRRVAGLQQYMWLTEDEGMTDSVSLEDIMLIVKQTLETRFGSDGFTLQWKTLPAITGNARQLEMLLTNVLDNAVRFAVSGRLPVVKVGAMLIESNYFRNLEGEYRYTDHLRLEIEDNGAGIDEAVQQQAFAMFYSANNPGGAGMGLALCTKIVEYHHGTITLRSAPGKGTTVTITLPLRNGANYNP